MNSQPSLGNRLDWLPGVYITHDHGGKVTGHTVTIRRGRPVVHVFSQCTLALVVENAGRQIDDPKVYRLTVAKSEE
jgi:hypothetical protein